MSKKRLQKYKEVTTYDFQKRAKSQEAPADGKQYARQDEQWSEVIIPGEEGFDDLTGYGTVEYDSYQDFNGYEGGPNGYFELDVDTSLNPENTVYDLIDNDSGMEQLYNFQNVELGKYYYIRFKNQYSFEPNPQMGMAMYYLNINGICDSGYGVFIPEFAELDYDAGSPDNVVVFIVNGNPTNQAELEANIQFISYSKGLPTPIGSQLDPWFNKDGQGFVTGIKVGSGLYNNPDGIPEAKVKEAPIDYAADMPYMRQNSNWVEGAFKNIPFQTLSQRRATLDLDATDTEDMWLGRATGTTNIDITTFNLLTFLSFGMGELTLSSNKSYVKPSQTQIRGWKGRYVLDPAGSTITFNSNYVKRAGSESWNAAATNIILEWEWVSNTICLYTITNIV